MSDFSNYGKAPPNPDEVATIVVGGGGGISQLGGGGGPGGAFTDWEQVYIQIKLFNGYGVFRFTAVERDPIPSLWQRIQFVPGNEVAIYLGGQLAIAGNIEIRQTAYDATSHGVMLQGSSYSKWAAKSSVQKNDGGVGSLTSGMMGGQQDSGNFDGMTFQQIAAMLLPKYGITPVFKGTLDAWPFKKLQAEVGETVFNFLERIARPRGVVIGSDENGQMVFYGAGGLQGFGDTLIEGQNILRMQAIWSAEENYSHIGVKGQTSGDDQMNMSNASEQEFWYGGRAHRYSPILTPAEQPVWNLAEIADRARQEARWRNSDTLTANVTVQGWKRASGTIWRPGEIVMVKSPMAMLDDMLGIQSVTYQQDSQAGTTTTLECVLPWKLDDGSQVGAPAPDGDPAGRPITDPNSTEPTFAPMQPASPNPPATLPGSEPTFGQTPGPPAPQNPPFGGT